MKHIILFIILSHFVIEGFCQTITGRVLDKDTQRPITYAIIYFEGTSIAIYSDEHGNYKLDLRNNIPTMPLTVSALGYFSVNINNYLSEKPVDVQLTPKIFELQNISVVGKGNPRVRNKNLEVFRREFLGRTKNAKNCQILNEDDIKFIMSANGDTLKAYTLKPLIVINKSLNYKITYFLDKFEYINSQSVNHLIGDFLFSNDTSFTNDLKMVELRRNYTYYGSKMHFFRALWQKDLGSAGFIIKIGDEEIAEKDLIRDELTLDHANVKKYLYTSDQLPKWVTIQYKPSQNESIMEILNNNIYFDKDGYFKGHNIIWLGEMALHGIADMLPYDFKPTCNAEQLYGSRIKVPVYRK